MRRVGKDISMQMEIQKKTGVSILISDTVNFTIKTATRDKEGHIMIKDQSRRYKSLNIYVPNTGAPQHIWQILTIKKRREINSSTIIVR